MVCLTGGVFCRPANDPGRFAENRTGGERSIASGDSDDLGNDLHDDLRDDLRDDLDNDLRDAIILPNVIASPQLGSVVGEVSVSSGNVFVRRNTRRS